MDNIQLVEKLQSDKEKLFAEISKVIIGQKNIIEHLFVSLLCQGHILLEGVPGLAKTLLIKILANALDLNFNRIQFTPDLMPSDITGTEIIEEKQGTGKRSFKFFKGPIFANIVLADEINRTPPKTQAALLEAMQEHKVTAGGISYKLEEPFFVLATQNPIEQEGTYPLPEAQLDRFMFNIIITYPSMEEEVDIVKSTTSTDEAQINPPNKKARETRRPRKRSSLGSSQPPPIIDRPKRESDIKADKRQKKQKAWILKIINPIRIKLKTAIPQEAKNKPHQVLRVRSAFFWDRPGSNGRIAKHNTVR